MTTYTLTQAQIDEQADALKVAQEEIAAHRGAAIEALAFRDRAFEPYLKPDEKPIERLKREIADCQALMDLYKRVVDERDALQAKLSAIEEPVGEGYFDPQGEMFSAVHTVGYLGVTEEDAANGYTIRKIYAAPVAPAQPDDSDMNQVHQGNAQVSYPTMYFGKAAQPLTKEKVYTMGDWFNDLENPHGNR